LPPTGSRQAGQRAGKAAFRARPKNVRNGAAKRARRVALTGQALLKVGKKLRK
jgi:hypothetical protein